MQVHSVLIIFLAFIGGLLFAYCFLNGRTSYYDTSTLKLVHLIFRHGERHPGESSLYPSNSYYDEKFYPEGYEQLTYAGKLTEYKLGIALRKRYDTFLGTKWNIKHLEARSTDFNRTKMSLQMVLAGLYPPQGFQVWTLYWQPIPYNYVPKHQDKELLPYLICPRFLKLMRKLEYSPEISHYLQRYNETYATLNKHTKRKIDVFNAFYLFIGFAMQEEIGYPLDEWTKTVYPEPLRSLTIDHYHILSNTTALRRVVAGYFIKKVLADIKAKIDGTLSPPERKVFLYSAHEMNLATILLSLNALKMDHMPPYAAYVAFELHNIDGVYGIKLFYENYKQQEPTALKVPGCDYFCPCEDLYRAVEEILPESDEECFGSS